MPASRAILADIHEQGLDPRVPYNIVGAAGHLKIRKSEGVVEESAPAQQPEIVETTQVVEIPVQMSVESAVELVSEEVPKVEFVETQIDQKIVDQSKKKKTKKESLITD